MITTIILGQLEIDHDRGVIYFHVEKNALVMFPPTPLCICCLPKPIPANIYCIDLTHMIGCGYERRR